jgi:hypothetical protein
MCNPHVLCLIREFTVKLSQVSNSSTTAAGSKSVSRWKKLGETKSKSNSDYLNGQKTCRVAEARALFDFHLASILSQMRSSEPASFIKGRNLYSLLRGVRVYDA